MTDDQVAMVDAGSLTIPITQVDERESHPDFRKRYPSVAVTPATFLLQSS